MSAGAGLLTAPEKALLREIALLAVAAAARGTTPPDAQSLALAAAVAWEPRLAEPRGAFVTLHRDGRLRGCIGHIEGHLPLAETVARNGRAAACEDPRFPPVGAAELPRLTLEVSALTPLRPVAGPDDIVVGEHGIVLDKGGRRAVFLPQVATEQGWNLVTTLGHLALKAGLGPAGWQEGARFHVFAAEVF